MADSNKILDFFQGYLARLNTRERIIFLVGIFAFIFLGIFLGISLSRSRGPGKKIKIDQLTAQRTEFIKTAQAYAQLKPVIDLIDSRVMQRPSDFDLYRKVNEIIERTNIRPFVVKMDPGNIEGKDFLDEEYVDLNLQRIDLRVLVDFLAQVEQLPGMVRIGQLTIKNRMDNSKTMDAVLRISAYKEKVK